MAADAQKDLEKYVAAIRREAFDAGYEAAMREIRELASTKAVSVSSRHRQLGDTRLLRPAQVDADTYVPKVPRGTARKLVHDAYQAAAPRAVGPTELQVLIKREHGVLVPFTSLRRAIDHWEDEKVIEQVGDTKTWRYAAKLRSVS